MLRSALWPVALCPLLILHAFITHLPFRRHTCGAAGAAGLLCDPQQAAGEAGAAAGGRAADCWAGALGVLGTLRKWRDAFALPVWTMVAAVASVLCNAEMHPLSLHVAPLLCCSLCVKRATPHTHPCPPPQEVEGDAWVCYPWDAEDIDEHNELGRQ